MPARIRFDCSVDGCNRPHAGRGYCKFHWKRWRLFGDPLREPPPRKPPQPCAVVGCQDIAKKNGMCDTHYHRVRAWGDPTIVKKVKSYEGRACSIDGCERNACWRGFCQMHGKRAWKRGDPLYVPQRNGYVRAGYRIRKIKGDAILEHRLVWERTHGPIPGGHVIHHIDGDKLNNDLSNLRLMTVGDHTILHRSIDSPPGMHWCRRCRQHLPSRRFYARRTRRGLVPYGYCKICHNPKVPCRMCDRPSQLGRCRSCAKLGSFSGAKPVKRIGSQIECRDCGALKSLDAFIGSSATYTKTGEISARCSECRLAYRRAAYAREEYKCQDCGTPNSPKALWCRPCEARRWLALARNRP